ncbi:auxin transporter-like protein 2 [Glycine soja]|uniref:auxin transporter-like protein 2 n=1 Tax=Glycine soja TaxID=3848 RepID=UPI00103BAF7E|nr:auxin transporter-like protein 2 [Glycine soja]
MVVLFMMLGLTVLPTRWLKFCLCCHTHFSQLGILSGTLGEVFYDLLGGWTAYLISTLYVEYRTRKEREELNFRNHVIQWVEILDGLLKKHWRNMGLASNYTFLLFGSIIQLIACARYYLTLSIQFKLNWYWHSSIY